MSSISFAPPAFQAWPQACPDPAIPGQSPLAEAPIPHYGCFIGEVGLFLPRGLANEAMPMPEVFALPNTAPWLLGLANRRGDVVPVFDLRALWFPERDFPGRRYLLVLDEAEAAVGLVIDGLPHPLRETAVPEALPDLPDTLRDHVRRPCLHGGNVYWEFRHDSFFPALRNSLLAEE